MTNRRIRVTADKMFHDESPGGDVFIPAGWMGTLGETAISIGHGSMKQEEAYRIVWDEGLGKLESNIIWPISDIREWAEILEE